MTETEVSVCCGDVNGGNELLHSGFCCAARRIRNLAAWLSDLWM
jgi:hypothetical protein